LIKIAISRYKIAVEQVQMPAQAVIKSTLSIRLKVFAMDGSHLDFVLDSEYPIKGISGGRSL
jgi:hypothetical protein